MTKFVPGDQIIGKGRVQLTVVAATDRQYWLQGDDGYCATYRASVIDREWAKIEPRFELGGVYRAASFTNAVDWTVVAVFDDGRAAIAWYADTKGKPCPSYLSAPAHWQRLR